MKNIERAAEFVLLMDKQLKNQLFVVNGEVQGKKPWENTFIKHQLDKRDAGGKFSVGDHIRVFVVVLRRTVEQIRAVYRYRYRRNIGY